MSAALKFPPYGRDTSAVDQVRYGVLVSGVKLVVESMLRMFRTPKGSLLDDRSWGHSLADRLGTDFSQADADALPGEIEAELEKDDRINNATVTATFSKLGAAARRMKIRIDVELSDGTSFALVLAYQDLALTVLDINFGGAAQ